MPGGRPRKYADKAAAQTADRLKAAQRKRAKKIAKPNGGASGVGGTNNGNSSYCFILEDVVRLRILVLGSVTNTNSGNGHLGLRINLQADPQVIYKIHH